MIQVLFSVFSGRKVMYFTVCNLKQKLLHIVNNKHFPI